MHLGCTDGKTTFYDCYIKAEEYSQSSDARGKITMTWGGVEGEDKKLPFVSIWKSLYDYIRPVVQQGDRVFQKYV